MTCVLIVGGTFDPPHRAHRALPALVAQTLGATRTLYVPAARNPLKSAMPDADDEDRVAMLELVATLVPGAEVSTVEIDRGAPSYFVDTLVALRATLGDDVDLRFLIGADQALDFDRWKDWQRILELATPVVILRPPWTFVKLGVALSERWGEAEGDRWLNRVVETPLVDVSATDVRERLRAGAAVDDLLDPPVAAYIREHGLYGA